MSKDTRISPNLNAKMRKFSVIFISMLCIGIVICTGLLIDQIINKRSILEFFDINLNFFYTKDQFLGFSCYMLILIGLFFVGIAFSFFDLTEDKNIILYLYSIGFLVISTSVTIGIALDADLRQQPLKLIAFIFYGLFASMTSLPSILVRIGYQKLARISFILFILILISFACLQSLLV
jgi:F0F1-type ATP synthase assembly protein I